MRSLFFLVSLLVFLPNTASGFGLQPLVASLKRAVQKVGTSRRRLDGAAALEEQVKNAPSLLDSLIPYTRMPLEHAITFPPEAYTSEDLFQVEKQRVLQPSWICVAHVTQIRNPGDYMTLDLLDEGLVIVNAGATKSNDAPNTNNNIQVLSRVCSHRWASVCESTTSKAANTKINGFTCPMHRWSFDLEGNLKGTPYMDDVMGFDKSNHGLRQYRSETIGGFVYVNIDGTAESLAPQISELTDWMENWDTENAELFNMDYELNYECDFNWVSCCRRVLS